MGSAWPHCGGDARWVAAQIWLSGERGFRREDVGECLVDRCAWLAVVHREDDLAGAGWFLQGAGECCGDGGWVVAEYTAAPCAEDEPPVAVGRGHLQDARGPRTQDGRKAVGGASGVPEVGHWP